MLWRNRIFTLAVVVLSGCARGASLETEQSAGQPVSSDPKFADACLIATTGADRHGVRLPKGAIKAIKAELKDKKVDCEKSQ
jgi:hypothetical protein